MCRFESHMSQSNRFENKELEQRRSKRKEAEANRQVGTCFDVVTLRSHCFEYCPVAFWTKLSWQLEVKWFLVGPEAAVEAGDAEQILKSTKAWGFGGCNWVPSSKHEQYLMLILVERNNHSTVCSICFSSCSVPSTYFDPQFFRCEATVKVTKEQNEDGALVGFNRPFCMCSIFGRNPPGDQEASPIDGRAGGGILTLIMCKQNANTDSFAENRKHLVVWSFISSLLGMPFCLTPFVGKGCPCLPRLTVDQCLSIALLWSSFWSRSPRGLSFWVVSLNGGPNCSGFHGLHLSDRTRSVVKGKAYQGMS